MAKQGLLEATVGIIAVQSKTKGEAFLKGVLYGFGAHNACPVPNWDRLKEHPESINVERQIRDVFEKARKMETAEVYRLLSLEEKK